MPRESEITFRLLCGTEIFVNLWRVELGKEWDTLPARLLSDEEDFIRASVYFRLLCYGMEYSLKDFVLVRRRFSFLVRKETGFITNKFNFISKKWRNLY